MQSPTLEQKLEIARRVHETFDQPKRWRQREWGRDDAGEPIDFDRSYNVDEGEAPVEHPVIGLAAAIGPGAPESARCFCLTAAVRIQCAAVVGDDPVRNNSQVEAVCAIYTECARRRRGRDTRRRAARLRGGRTPHLNSLIVWNDEKGRTFEDVRTLTGDVVRHLETELERTAEATPQERCTAVAHSEGEHDQAAVAEQTPMAQCEQEMRGCADPH